ncbi:porin [Muribaculum intestinale]|uniref:porin n=1 Tax=Muribaculum intestinale TaxID=1796646 RepID=UPI0025A9430C|nr:porin [Muribaculum intestinale]
MKKIFAIMACCAAATTMYASDVTESSYDVLNAPMETPSSASVPASSAAGATEDWKSQLSKMVKVSGYLQAGYNYNSLGSGSSSFQAKRLRLILDGQVCKNGSVRVQIEAFNGIAGSTNGNGQKNIQVMDAFFTYKFNPAFQVRVGQFYTPLGYENYDISPATLETVDFSNICYRMACRNAIGYDFVDYGRDLGIMLMGDLLPSAEGFNYLSYNFAVTNGQLPCKDDNNKSKDIIAALTVRPLKYFNVKAAYNYGEYQTNKDLENEEGEEIPGKYCPMHRFVGGFWYNNPTGLDVRAEYGYLRGKKEGISLAHETGFYALAGYHFGKFLPVVRYDMYHDSLNKLSLNNYDRVLLGCTWEPFGNLKVQLNYMLSMYGKDVREASNNGKSTSSQLQLMGLFKF